MRIDYLEQDRFFRDFLPLIAELLCGTHYDGANEQHVRWLRDRVAAFYALSGTAICLLTDPGEPVGFIFILHDKGLEGVRCFGKVAIIEMFGLLPEHRSKGLGETLLLEAEAHSKRRGAQCLYVNTYARNAGAIRYYTKHGFIPVAYHPGENGIDDRGQVYLYKEIGQEET